MQDGANSNGHGDKNDDELDGGSEDESDEGSNADGGAKGAVSSNKFKKVG